MQNTPITTTAAGDLFDLLIEQMDLKNDRELARRLDLSPSLISRLRKGSLAVTDTVLLCIHEESAMPIREIKARLRRTYQGDRLAAA